MAKVKCLICGEYFDREKEPFVKIKNRYAHKECYLHQNEKLSKEAKDKMELEEYILNLFKINYLTPKIRNQIKLYMSAPYNYSYRGILRSLKYWYEVKKNDLSKSRGGIGIVPSIYQDAYNYYYSIWLANQQNKSKAEVSTVKETIYIKTPERKEKTRKLFTFLDEEG